MNKQNSRKQPWGPFIKQVLGPNVPWLWYIANLIVPMALMNLMMLGYELEAQIMSGEAVSDNSILWTYVGLMVLSLVLGLLVSFSQSWAGYYTDRKIQRRLWKKMIRMPMRLYDRQNPSSLISRVTIDTTLVTYSLEYVFQLVTFVYALALMLFEIWQMNSSITLALLCVLPYIWAVMVIPGRFMFTAKKAIQEKLAKLTTFVAERLGSITLVKSAANEDADLQLGYQCADTLDRLDLKNCMVLLLIGKV